LTQYPLLSVDRTASNHSECIADRYYPNAA